jgi:hypothetical protein
LQCVALRFIAVASLERLRDREAVWISDGHIARPQSSSESSPATAPIAKPTPTAHLTVQGSSPSPIPNRPSRSVAIAALPKGLGTMGNCPEGPRLRLGAENFPGQNWLDVHHGVASIAVRVRERGRRGARGAGSAAGTR